MKKIYLLFLLSACLSFVAKAQSYCTPSYYYGYSSYYSMSFLQIPGDGGTMITDTFTTDTSSYMDLTGMSTVDLTAGSTYYCLMEYGSSSTGVESQAWIDFNGDGTFDASEAVTSVFGNPDTMEGFVYFNLVVPAGAAGGTHRLRVREAYTLSSTASAAMDPCNSGDMSGGTYTGYYYGSTADFLASITSAATCTGAPAPGVASYTSYSSCGIPTATVSDAGYTAGTDLQWQQSTDSVTWTNVPGATAATYNPYDYTYPTYFRCMVTCSASGMSAYSNVVTLTGNLIAGTIGFSGTAPDSVMTMVWLIQYDDSSTMIYAVDSVYACLTAGPLPYYEFNNEPAGNYLVKAALLDETPGTSGYVPTYATSTVYWDSAYTVGHATGSDTGVNITMQYGTVPSGPGFISGSVTTGAGKGTSGTVPAPGVMVMVRDAANHVITFTTTDAGGNYSFSSLAAGTYNVYPEELAYATTPSAPITITDASPSVSGIGFYEDATAHTLKPVTEAVATVAAVAPFSAYPNPANTTLNIKWQHNINETATITITDAVGRIAMKAELNNTTSKLDISQLKDGIYLLSVNGNTINYTQKLSVQH